VAEEIKSAKKNNRKDNKELKFKKRNKRSEGWKPGICNQAYLV
jgi:hypothetical protein